MLCKSCNREFQSENISLCSECLWKKVRYAYKKPENINGQTYSLSSQTYILEKMDPKHRRGKDIIAKWHIWKNENTRLPFFEWLDAQEEGLPERRKAPKLIYNTSEEEKNKLRIEYNENNKLINSESKEIIDSNGFQGKFPSFGAYTMTGPKLFFSEHRRIVTHASLQGGTFVHAAGMMRVTNGKIVEIMNCSGHYKPGLESLYHTILNIPEEVFSRDCKIHYKVCKFATFAKKNKDASSRFNRWLGAKAGRYYKTKSLSYNDFKDYASIQLSDKAKLINQYDGRGNHILSAVWESYLSKAIIESLAWIEALTDISNNIFNKLESVNIPRIQNRILVDIQTYFSSNGINDLEQANYLSMLAFIKSFMSDLSNCESIVLFHKRFCEHIIPIIREVQEGQYFRSIEMYNILRKPELYSRANRGCNGNSNFIRKWKRFRNSKECRDLGIISKESSADNLKGFYSDNKTGIYKPAMYAFKPNCKKDPRALARRKYYDQEQDDYNTYQSELKSRDIVFGTGTSGTASKVISCFMYEDIFEGKDKEKNLNNYLMLLAAVLCARGHHSMYEVLFIKRTLYEEDFSYTPTIIREKLLTPEFKATPNYTQAFDNLAEYIDIKNDESYYINYDGYNDAVKQNFKISKETVQKLFNTLIAETVKNISRKIGLRTSANIKEYALINAVASVDIIDLTDEKILEILQQVIQISLRKRNSVGFSSETKTGRCLVNLLKDKKYYYFSYLIKKIVNINQKEVIKYRDLRSFSQLKLDCILKVFNS